MERSKYQQESRRKSYHESSVQSRKEAPLPWLINNAVAVDTHRAFCQTLFMIQLLPLPMLSYILESPSARI
jgi:hypothetical protein